MSQPDDEILQIIPADGWYARFTDETDIPLVCFALIKHNLDEQDKSVEPMAYEELNVKECIDIAEFEYIYRKP